MNFLDSGPIFSAFAAVVTTLLISFIQELMKRNHESIVGLLSRLFYSLKQNLVATGALILSSFCTFVLLDSNYSSGPQNLSLFGPYRINACQPLDIQVPIAGSTSNDYAPLVSNLALDSIVSDERTDDPGNNALYGFSVALTQVEEFFRLELLIELNDATNNTDNSIRRCDFLKDKSRIEDSFAKVYLIYKPSDL